jgi:hypothetical protein
MQMEQLSLSTDTYETKIKRNYKHIPMNLSSVTKCRFMLCDPIFLVGCRQGFIVYSNIEKSGVLLVHIAFI